MEVPSLGNCMQTLTQLKYCSLKTGWAYTQVGWGMVLERTSSGSEGAKSENTI